MYEETNYPFGHMQICVNLLSIYEEKQDKFEERDLDREHRSKFKHVYYNGPVENF